MEISIEARTDFASRWTFYPLAAFLVLFSPLDAAYLRALHFAVFKINLTILQS